MRKKRRLSIERWLEPDTGLAHVGDTVLSSFISSEVGRDVQFFAGLENAHRSVIDTFGLFQ